MNGSSGNPEALAAAAAMVVDASLRTPRNEPSSCQEGPGKDGTKHDGNRKGKEPVSQQEVASDGHQTSQFLDKQAGNGEGTQSVEGVNKPPMAPAGKDSTQKRIAGGVASETCDELTKANSTSHDSLNRKADETLVVYQSETTNTESDSDSELKARIERRFHENDGSQSKENKGSDDSTTSEESTDRTRETPTTEILEQNQNQNNEQTETKLAESTNPLQTASVAATTHKHQGAEEDEHKILNPMSNDERQEPSIPKAATSEQLSIGSARKDTAAVPLANPSIPLASLIIPDAVSRPSHDTDHDNLSSKKNAAEAIVDTPSSPEPVKVRREENFLMFTTPQYQTTSTTDLEGWIRQETMLQLSAAWRAQRQLIRAYNIKLEAANKNQHLKHKQRTSQQSESQRAYDYRQDQTNPPQIERQQQQKKPPLIQEQYKPDAGAGTAAFRATQTHQQGTEDIVI